MMLKGYTPRVAISHFVKKQSPPFGLALSGVAVPAAAQPQVRQDEYKSAVTNLYLPS